MWLSDPSSLERLSSLKPEGRREKRRFGGDSSSDRSRSPPDQDDLSNDAKRPRAAVSDEQRDALSLAFALDPFPRANALEFLAAELGLGVGTVSAWFQTHRLRLKQLHGVSTEALFPAAGGGENGVGDTFDPTKFRILMAHRRMEAQAGGGGSRFPFLPAGLSPALLGLPPRADGLDAGLDLRFRLDDGEEAEMSEDGGSDRRSGGEEDRRSPESTPRSRRKPAAPQWVNPDWPEAEGGPADKEAELPRINGVCVRNISALSGESRDSS